LSSGAEEIEAMPVVEAAPRPLTKMFTVAEDGKPN